MTETLLSAEARNGGLVTGCSSATTNVDGSTRNFQNIRQTCWSAR